ncbi:MAG: hypothetical protein ACOYT4_00220 [Nanoarchaeota archaeon]
MFRTKSIHPYCAKLRTSLEDSIKMLGFRTYSWQNLAKELEKFHLGSKQFYEVPASFGQYVKKQETVDFSLYHIELNYGRTEIYDSNHPAKIKNSICRDAPYQFILRQNQDFIAILGFEPIWNGILISQIQGIPGKHEELSKFIWPRALLNMATNWAKENKIRFAAVLPYYKNKWKIVRTNKYNSYLIYDFSAKKEGFNFDSKLEVYAKRLF